MPWFKVKINPKNFADIKSFIVTFFGKSFEVKVVNQKVYKKIGTNWIGQDSSEITKHVLKEAKKNK